MRGDLVALGQWLAQCLADAPRQARQVIVVAAHVHHRAVHPVVAKQRGALQVLRDKGVTLAQHALELVRRHGRESGQGGHVDLVVVAQFVGFLQDERDAEVKGFKVFAQFCCDHVARGRAAVTIVIACGARQAFVDQIVIERLKRRVLHDGQHIEQAAGFFAGLDQFAVFAFDVVVFRIAPHQAQAAPDGLLQQNLRLAGAQRHDDADVVHVKAFAQHQHAHDHTRGGVVVHAEQALTHRCPVFFAQLGFFARVDGHHLVFAQAFLVAQELGHQRRHGGVFADHQHLGVAVRIDGRKVFFQLAQLGQACPKHHPLAFAQGGVTRFIALGLELQRQCADFLAAVQHQGFATPARAKCHACNLAKIALGVYIRW